MIFFTPLLLVYIYFLFRDLNSAYSYSLLFNPILHSQIYEILQGYMIDDIFDEGFDLHLFFKLEQVKLLLTVELELVLILKT